MQPRDPIAAVTHADPDAYLDLLARTPGLRRDDALGLWVAADAAAVAAVFDAPQARVRPAGEAVPAAIAGTPAGALFSRLVRMNDGERHRAPKQVIERALAAVPAAQVQACARRLAAVDAADMGRPERLGDWAMDTPVATVAALLGWGDDAAREVAAWVRDFVACLSPLSTPEALKGASVAADELTALARSLLQSADPQTLACTVRAGAAEAGWSDEPALVANLVGLLSQTCEATAGLVGNAIVALARRPWLLAEVRAMPQGWDALVHETSRHDAPVQNTRRFIAEATTIGGVALAAGDAVLLVLAAANRDPALNPEPQRFRLDRPARVREVAPYLFAHGTAYLLRQRSQRLACGSAAAFKGAVIGVE